MASSGQAITQYVYAFIEASNAPKTGDAANIAVRIVADGTEATPAGSVAEVDATNLPGVYKVAITGPENTGSAMLLGGKSSTGGVAVLPTFWTNENLPTAAPGASNGVLIAGSNAATTYASMTVTGNLAVGGNLALTGNFTGAAITFSGNLSVSHLVGIIDALSVTTYAESSAVPAATATLKDKIVWLATLARNKITCTSTAEKLFADDNSTVIGTAVVGDDGATGTRAKFA